MRRERNRDERRAEAGDAEDERAEERDRGKQQRFCDLAQAPMKSSRALERFIERSRGT
jgi:hypothetical protein